MAKTMKTARRADDAPATKGDLRRLESALRSELASKNDLRGFAGKDDLKNFPTKDDLKNFATKDDLTGFARQEALDSLDAKVDRIAVRVAKLEGDVADIRLTMATTMATKDDVRLILNAIDRFASRSEQDTNARVIHGQTLTEHAVTLKDHEARLTKLESAPGA